jgi:H+/Cl- antiporter ClcA
MVMSNFRIRPLTILLVVLAIALVAGGVVYFTETAHDLPAFFPGHDVHSTTHHVKYGIALVTLAVLALGAAWFTTAPERPEK